MTETPPPGRRPTRLGRLADYVRVMFPPAVLLPSAVAHYAAIDLSVRALAHAPLRPSWRSALGALTVVLFSLLMRVQDELKDVATDLALGRAGDPRYKDRPIVRGLVDEGDIAALRTWALGLVVLANAPLGFPLPFFAFLAAFVLVWLSYRWFFWPRIKTSLLLAFATHNPITLVVACYAATIPAGEVGWERLEPARFELAALLVGLWFPVAAWETSRKVRLPADETDYTTYSKVLGWRVAAVVPAVFVALSVVGIGLAARAAGLSSVFLAVLAAAGAVPIFASLRLLIAPTTARAELRPAAEVYAVVANAGLPIALAWRSLSGPT